MSELPNGLRNLAKTVNEQDTVLVAMINEAAKCIDELEKPHYLGGPMKNEIDRLRDEIGRMRDDLCREQQKNKPMKEQLEQANEIIAKIAKAAECENFADIILARVEAQNQQCNAMTRICEGHIATSRKETAKANDYLAANKKLSERVDELNSQDNTKRAMLHVIADKLGAGSRNALPVLDWYLNRIDLNRIEDISAGNKHREYLDIIGQSVGKPGLSYKDLAEYFRGLDVGKLKEIADKTNATADKLADAERYVEARDITLRQLAHALGVDQAESGWATKMINKAEHYRLVFFSKAYKWEQAKTDALQKLLQKFGMWPAHNNVEGLEKFSTYVTGMKTELDQATSRMVAKNNRISELEHENDRLAAESENGRTATKELDLAVGAIKRMHDKLEKSEVTTGIWPDDGKFRAKLDDVEWCLNVYIGRVIADAQLYEADTRFIADVRDTLSHEILRRNKQ